MKRIDFTGWKDVYLFTLLQTCKNKAFIITVTFMCIVSCAVFPVLGFFLEDNSVEEIIDVEMNQEENATNDYETEKLSGIRNAFFYYDDTDEWLANIFNDTEGTNPYHLQKVEQEFIEDTGLELEDKSDCIFIIKEEDKAYRVEIITNWDVLDISEEIDCIAAWIASEINEAKRLSYSNIEYIEDNSPMICSYIDEKEQDNSALLNMTGYGIQLAFITILTLFIAFSGEGIATSVATEKSGKIVEYLMTSVRPMALVIGKVLAILTTVFFQLAAVTICAFVSGMIVGISSPDVWTRLTDGITNTVVFAGEIHQGTILQLIISILLVIGGFLFFALLAGLAGATVSKLEEISEGIVIFTLVLIVGAYMGIALAIGQVGSGSVGTGIYETICYFSPISAMFTVPPNLLLGNASIGMAVVAVVIQYLFVFLLLILTSRVYEYMLFYNGATLKFRDIIYIAIHGRKKEVNK